MARESCYCLEHVDKSGIARPPSRHGIFNTSRSSPSTDLPSRADGKISRSSCSGADRWSIQDVVRARKVYLL